MKTAEQAIDVYEPQPLPASMAVDPMIIAMERIARDPNSDVSKFQAIAELIREERREKAARAFDDSMAKAKAEIKPIIKNRVVDFTSTKGRTNYKYEDLSAISDAVDPIISKYGLSYRFRTTSLPNEPISVTCIITGHGHREENTLSAGRDDSGNKNSIQAIGSTVTYLQRYTLKAALGLAASNDDDGRKADTPPDGPISEKQVEQIMAAVVRTNSSIDGFCRLYGAAHIKDLLTSRLKDAVGMLQKKATKEGVDLSDIIEWFAKNGVKL